MLKEFLRNWSPRRTPSELPRQVGAMPYAIVEGQVVVLLITSRKSGRWIFPKGGLIDSLTPWQSAAQEAFEEAGVSGEVEREPIGSYRAARADAGHTLAQVDLYPLRVTQQHDRWPEMANRHRHWALAGEAKRLLNRRGPAALVDAFCQRAVSSPRGR